MLFCRFTKQEQNKSRQNVQNQKPVELYIVDLQNQNQNKKLKRFPSLIESIMFATVTKCD